MRYLARLLLADIALVEFVNRWLQVVTEGGMTR